MRWIEKYCINSSIRLNKLEAEKYWEDPTRALKEFNSVESNIDRQIYEMIVPKGHQGLDTTYEANLEHFFNL